MARAASLVVFSPMPPMPTGIGDYSYDLLALLQPHYRCTVVVEDVIPDLRAPPGVTLLRLAEYEAAEAAHGEALHIYHIGNNPDHVYMLPVLARHPGLIVLHDPGLHHLLDCATAALGDADGYCAAIEAEYGAPGLTLALQWRHQRLRDRSLEYEMPMLRQLLGPARHVVVHSRHAAHKVLREVPDARITIAPHLFVPPPPPDAAVTRARLGIDPGDLVFLSLGFVSHIKRVDTALRAIARIADLLPPFRYVVAGEITPEHLDVARLAAQLGLSRQVLTTGYVAEADFPAMIAIADVVINLRHPVGGETSGTLIRALGQGSCVVVVDAGPFAEIPDGAAIKLPWGPSFEMDLAETLLRLASQPAERAMTAKAAAASTARNHPQMVRATYSAAIDEAVRAADPPWRCRSRFAYNPPQVRPDAVATFWSRVGAMPLAAGCAPGAVLCIGDPASLRAFGPDPNLADLNTAIARTRDLILADLHAGDPLLAVPDLLARLNRGLSFGGVLVLSLTGLDPGDHALAARRTGAELLRAAGFRIELGVSAAPPTLDQTAPTGPQMVWRAVKVSEFAARPMIDAA